MSAAVGAALDRAPEIARTGLPLLADKSPACAGGFNAATKDPDRIRELFANPDAVLVGVPTGAVSGIDALDVDRHKAAGETVDQRERAPDTADRTHPSGLTLFLLRSRK